MLATASACDLEMTTMQKNGFLNFQNNHQTFCIFAVLRCSSNIMLPKRNLQPHTSSSGVEMNWPKETHFPRGTRGMRNTYQPQTGHGGYKAKLASKSLKRWRFGCCGCFALSKRQSSESNNGLDSPHLISSAVWGGGKHQALSYNAGGWSADVCWAGRSSPCCNEYVVVATGSLTEAELLPTSCIILHDHRAFLTRCAVPWTLVI
jgi:hypothetical protein